MRERTNVTTTEYFGGCPFCGRSDGYMNIGADHYGSCETHKTKWYFGSNLFSCWRHETDEDWRRNEDILEDYLDVKPIHPEPTLEEVAWRLEDERMIAEAESIDKGFGVIYENGVGRALEDGENIFELALMPTKLSGIG